MARRKRVQGLSPFSWEKEAGLSAARQRLLGQTEATPPTVTRTPNRVACPRLVSYPGHYCSRDLRRRSSQASVADHEVLSRACFTVCRRNLPLCGGGAMKAAAAKRLKYLSTCVIQDLWR
jgi:hypothetical protein